MSRDSTSLAAAPLRPTFLDYFFILAGCSLSLVLVYFHPLHVRPGDEVASRSLAQAIGFLPQLMRLPEGILLLWPFFFALQLLRGRPAALTAVEWLWVLSWLGIAVLTALSAWQVWGTLPEAVHAYRELPRKLWYVILAPSMAVLGLCLALAALFRREPLPWTHTFGLVLLLWPVGPLLGIVTLGKFGS